MLKISAVGESISAFSSRWPAELLPSMCTVAHCSQHSCHSLLRYCSRLLSQPLLRHQRVHAPCQHLFARSIHDDGDRRHTATNFCGRSPAHDAPRLPVAVRYGQCGVHLSSWSALSHISTRCPASSSQQVLHPSLDRHPLDSSQFLSPCHPRPFFSRHRPLFACVQNPPTPRIRAPRFAPRHKARKRLVRDQSQDRTAHG